MSDAQPNFPTATQGESAYLPTRRADQAGLGSAGFADQLSIETPEQVALSFPVAGIGSRFVALALDHLIQAGVVMAALLLFALLQAAFRWQNLGSSAAGKWFLAGVIFAGFLLIWGYFTLFEALWRGQTPGKRALKLRVITDSGRQVTLFESLARNLLRVADFLPSFYLAGVAAMLFNPRNKRLGDLAAGTLVVHERGEAQPLMPSPALFRSQAESPFASPTGPFPADALARLSPQDLLVVEAFAARALDLPLEVRATVAEQILRTLTERMGVPFPEGNPERALEAIGVGLRRQRRVVR